MKSLIKIVLYTAPVVALIFFYVIGMQSQHSAEMTKENTEFMRDWAEFQEDFTDVAKEKEKYQARAAAAEEKMKEAEERERVETEKLKKFRAEFEKAINDNDPELKKMEKQLELQEVKK